MLLSHLRLPTEGCTVVCSPSPGELTRQALPLWWQGGACEWGNFRQSLTAAHPRHNVHPALSVTELCRLLPFVLIWFQRWGGGAELRDVIKWFQTHPGTQGPVINTSSLGFSVPSVPKSRDTGEHWVVDGSSQSPATGEKTGSPWCAANPACSLSPTASSGNVSLLNFYTSHPQQDSVS